LSNQKVGAILPLFREDQAEYARKDSGTALERETDCGQKSGFEEGSKMGRQIQDNGFACLRIT
jgi:hypothetical protein